MPVPRFAVVTAFAALLWIGGIFAITKLLGSQALIWLSFVQSKIAAIVFTTLLLAGAVFAFKKSGYALAFWSAALLRRFHSPLANQRPEVHSAPTFVPRPCLNAPQQWLTPHRHAPSFIPRLRRGAVW